jgi:hypothetical protein
MALKTVTIPKAEYMRLKKCEQVDEELLSQIITSLEDIKAGRIKRVC